MTFKELLDSVTFDDVEKQIVRLYPNMEHSLGWCKLHFDMLRLMKPKHHDGANDDVCHITIKITHHVLRDEESELIETISEKIDDRMTHGIVDIIIDVIPKLGHQTLISVVGYNSDNPITYDTDQL